MKRFRSLFRHYIYIYLTACTPMIGENNSDYANLTKTTKFGWKNETSTIIEDRIYCISIGRQEGRASVLKTR